MHIENFKFQVAMQPCPVEITLNLISNKWKILIIRELLTETKRFSHLKSSIHGISQKVLTQNLRQMEHAGIVSRTVFDEVPPRVEYKLSELGNSMKPILAAMQEWGIDYLLSNKGSE